LTRATKTIIAEDSGAPLCRHIVEREDDKSMLQHALDHSVEDYNVLVMGNKSLLSERNELKCRCEDLEAKVKTVKAHGEKRLRDFEDGLFQKLEELHRLYAGNVETIGGLCSRMPAGEPSTEDYLCWLPEEVSGVPNMFNGVNENFATAAIEGALVMAGDTVDLDAI
jgi:hypothetical protein